MYSPCFSVEDQKYLVVQLGGVSSEVPRWSFSRKGKKKGLQLLWNTALDRRGAWLGCPVNCHASFSALFGCINPLFPRSTI